MAKRLVPPRAALSGNSGYGIGPMMEAVRSKMTFKPLVYGYANSRVHGMVSALIPGARLREIADVRTVDALIEMLERTPYKDDLVALSLRFKREDLVELALGRRFAGFASKLLRITPAQGRPTVRALLARWDVHNLKTIILARKQKKKFEDVAPYLVLAGSLREEELRELSGTGGAEGFYATLRATTFGREFLSRSPARVDPGQIRKMFMTLDSETAVIEPLLGALDVYAYQLADESVSPGDEDADAVRALLRREADAKNMSTVLRLVKAAEGAADRTSRLAAVRHYIVPGGSMDKRMWALVASEGSVEDIVAAAAHKIPTLQVALAKYRESRSVSSFEIALAATNVREGLKTFHLSGVSLSVIVGALLLQETEMNNIRKIVRAKAQGLPDEEIKKMLVLVD